MSEGLGRILFVRSVQGYCPCAVAANVRLLARQGLLTGLESLGSLKQEGYRSWSLNCSEKLPVRKRPKMHATSLSRFVLPNSQCFKRRHIMALALPCHRPDVSAITNSMHRSTIHGSGASKPSASSRRSCFDKKRSSAWGGGTEAIGMRPNVRANRETTAGHQARTGENVPRTARPGLVACRWASPRTRG